MIRASCDDIRQQHAFKPRHLILQRQFSLFEALQLKLFDIAGSAQPGDHLVEVAVL